MCCTFGVKDPVIHHDAGGWRAWLCCHPLDVPGAEENWFERTGLAVPSGDALVTDPDSPVIDVRYLDVLALPDGRTRIYYGAGLPDESHELRTELL